ncbi:MAG: dihydrodipicolinate reductase C-terminal domain-containing protein [Rhodothermales bacterium]|nr:dihydrodipicolinate reductase C-terminal domain-containing protein [Rhodothermales bacterium]
MPADHALKIALVGTGRMGQAVEAAVADGPHRIVARFDEANPLLDARDPDDLNGADVAIDFTAPSVALDHLHRYSFWGLDAVVGTTGWYGEAEKVRAWVEEGQNGVLYAPNFSLGVAALVRALRGALPLLERLDEYDPYVHEVHHTGKVDSPSGTALLLADELLAGLSRKDRAEVEAQHGRIDPAALHVTSTRAGAVFGEHTVAFDSPYDQLLFRHVAKGREAFAAGAVRAAAWVHGRAGLFTLDDLLADLEAT